MLVRGKCGISRLENASLLLVERMYLCNMIGQAVCVIEYHGDIWGELEVGNQEHFKVNLQANKNKSTRRL